MDYNLLFLVGNVIADASIAAFAFSVWLQERQEFRLRQLTALLLADKILNERQTAIIDACVFIRDRQELEKYSENYHLKASDLNKLISILNVFRYLRFFSTLILILFVIGIAIEAYALAIAF